MITENIKMQALIQALDFCILMDTTEYRAEACQITDKMKSYIRARVLKMEEKLTEQEIDRIMDLCDKIITTINQEEINSRIELITNVDYETIN